jgi:hypothetical protein
MAFLNKLLDFLQEQKKIWFLPFLFAILFLSCLFLFTQGSVFPLFEYNSF